MSVPTIRIADRKDAACRWGKGPRRIGFGGCKFYGDGAAYGIHPCDTHSNRTDMTMGTAAA